MRLGVGNKCFIATVANRILIEWLWVAHRIAVLDHFFVWHKVGPNILSHICACTIGSWWAPTRVYIIPVLSHLSWGPPTAHPCRLPINVLPNQLPWRPFNRISSIVYAWVKGPPAPYCERTLVGKGAGALRLPNKKWSRTVILYTTLWEKLMNKKLLGKYHTQLKPYESSSRGKRDTSSATLRSPSSVGAGHFYHFFLTQNFNFVQIQRQKKASEEI